jgi:hypothetical protein
MFIFCFSRSERRKFGCFVLSGFISPQMELITNKIVSTTSSAVLLSVGATTAPTISTMSGVIHEHALPALPFNEILLDGSFEVASEN